MPSAWPAPATRTNSDGHVWPAGHGGPARSAHARTANNPPGTPQTADFGPFFVRRANFIALAPTIRPSRENFFAHRTQPRGNCETAITSATADAGQRETTITSATADAGQRETTITNATEKRIKNAHFSPAKAMAVSVGAEPARAKAMSVSSEARPARAKATPVSRERFVIPVDYGGAWPGFNPTRRALRLAARTASGRAAAHGRTKQPGPTSQSQRRPEHQRSRKQQAQSRIQAAPPVWRAPEGPEGLAAAAVGGGGAWPGFETTRRAELVARTARGRAAAHGRTKQPGPAGHAKQPGPAGGTTQNLRNWAASRPTARWAGNAILKSPGPPQCRRRDVPRALPGMIR